MHVTLLHSCLQAQDLGSVAGQARHGLALGIGVGCLHPCGGHGTPAACRISRRFGLGDAKLGASAGTAQGRRRAPGPQTTRRSVPCSRGDAQVGEGLSVSKPLITKNLQSHFQKPIARHSPTNLLWNISSCNLLFPSQRSARLHVTAGKSWTGFLRKSHNSSQACKKVRDARLESANLLSLSRVWASARLLWGLGFGSQVKLLSTVDLSFHCSA